MKFKKLTLGTVHRIIFYAFYGPKNKRLTNLANVLLFIFEELILM